MTRTLRTFSLFLWCTLFIGIVPAVCDESSESKEYAIKAAFMYNFAKFVEWPPGSFEKSDPFHLCILGESPFGASLKKLESKVVQGRTVAVRHISNGENVGKCHILFVAQSEQDHFTEILANMKGQGVLTVGDMKGFAYRGGMINFFMNERKVRFQINAETAEKAGLKISSKLLKLAQIVGSQNQ